MARLALLFIVVPLVELALLIEIGRRLGTGATLGLIVATGLLGAYLARRQGLAVLRRVRAELAAGRAPADQLADGAMILVAGALLMTPGILTDAFGFFCLVPAGRKLLKRWLRRWSGRMIQRGSVSVMYSRGESRISGDAEDVPPPSGGDHRQGDRRFPQP